MSATNVERAVSDPDEMARRIGFVMALRARGVRDVRVLSALERVPRSLFVAPEFADIAYADRNLPLMCGQTLERPSHVARMLDMLGVEAHHRVLEIGTGSGWQTCILARLAREVVSLERYRGLSSFAAECLRDLAVENCQLRLGDGLLGAPDMAPFDRIIVNGCMPQMPRQLIEQLSPNGVMLCAIGSERGLQDLMRYSRSPAGTVRMIIGKVRCAPMVSGVALAS